jgi:hypothetical protein
LVSFCTLVLASSKVTTASRVSKVTSTLLTPSTLEIAFLTVIGQAEQVMPGTDSVTVWVAAHGGNNGSEGKGGKQLFHGELL